MAAGITFNPELSDVDNDAYLSVNVSVTSSPIEAKVGVSRLSGREMVMIQNKGPKTLYYGPSGVTATTGMPLEKEQYVALPIGDSIGVFLVCDSGDTATAIVQEIA